MNTNSPKKIFGIIGLGWLGKPLAEELRNSGHEVWGTHRDTFTFGTSDFPQTFCDVLILNTPPLTKMSPIDFVSEVFLHQNSRLIFVSSTGVYAANSGIVNESTEPLPGSNSGIWLVEVENLLRQMFQDRLTIVRPGGLIGGERHPVYSLSGRKGIGGAKTSVNLIHRDDVIGIIMALDVHPEIKIVNAVAPYHPTKEAYYGEWVKKLNLNDIEFSSENTSDRRVESANISKLYMIWKCPRLDRL